MTRVQQTSSAAAAPRAGGPSDPGPAAAGDGARERPPTLAAPSHHTDRDARRDHPGPRIALVAPRNMRFTPQAATSIDLHIHETARWSRFREHITVFAEEVEAPFDDVEARFWPKGRAKGHLERLLARERPDLIVAHQHLPTAIRLVARFPWVPVALVRHNFQNPPRNPFSGWLKRACFNRLAGIAFVSERCRADFHDHWPQVRPPTFVTPNGVDSRQWGGAGDKEPVVLFCGRMAPEKGVLEAALALEQVLARRSGWQGLFICAHSPEHDRYDTEVRRVLARLGPRVRLVSNVSHAEVCEAMARCSIALAPTQGEEPFGRVAIEAMASGAAVIASRAGGLVEVVGEAGVLLTIPDAPHLAEAVLRLIDDGPERARLSAAARARVRERYDLTRSVAAFDRMAETLLGWRWRRAGARCGPAAGTTDGRATPTVDGPGRVD